MIGILIEVGKEKVKPNKIEEILKSKDRTKFGKTAPACGLYLTEVTFK